MKRSNRTPPEPPSNTVPMKKLIWSVAIASTLIMIGGFGLSLLYVFQTGDYRGLLSHQLLIPVSTIIYASIGALIVSRRPKNPIGWIFAVVGLFHSLNALAVGYSAYTSIFSSSDAITGGRLADWLDNWVWMPEVMLPTTFVFLLFPDGRLPSPRWRLVAWPAALGLAIVVLGIAFHPGPLESWGLDEPNPFGIVSARSHLEILVNLGNVLLTAGVIGSVAALVVRFRKSRGVERQQMKWLVYAAGLMVLAFILLTPAWTIWSDNPLVNELGISLTSMVILGIAVAAGIAILRHRLYDIDLIISRTLVYGALTAGVVGVYALVVGAMGILFQARGNWIIALLATGLVAVLFQPMRDRLQRWVNHLVYGQRDEPFEVLASLGQRLENILSPQMVYATIVETVARALKLPYVAISLRQDDHYAIIAEYGKTSPEPAAYALTYQGENVGQLLVGPRVPYDAFSEVEDRLLRNIARQAGAAVHAARLTADLQRSRQRLVTAREEERRRLRRDLHDGLGPRLAALTLKIDAVRNLLGQDPDTADEILNQLKIETKSALEDIRRIAYDLRPPALDELGLIPALRQQIASLSHQDGMQISFEAPDEIPPLPAAVEVAAYRIALESLINVIHHARAKNCHLRIGFNQQLELEVCDDGLGLPEEIRFGVGLRSMGERAAELGGECLVTPRPEGGTRVLARLPLNNTPTRTRGTG